MGGTYFKTSQEWLDESMLLIQAQPESTRITTRYAVKPPRPRRMPEDEDLPENPTAEDTARHERRKRLAEKKRSPRAVIVLKTYDPETGCCLKYRTTKAAEVGRLVVAMGRLGRGMAALPLDVPADPAPGPAAAEEKTGGKKEKAVSAPVAGGGVAAAATAAAAAAAAGSSKEAAKDGQAGGKTGGGKKKKKGKK